MAYLRCDFNSIVLDQQSSMAVILPEAYKPGASIKGNTIEKDFPVLYLLHGYNGDETVWQRFSSLERYVNSYPLAVVMPRGNHGFYVNHPEDGYQYLTFLTEELPGIVSHFFNISTRPEDTFIAGLSMGGYGAVRCAMERPDRYAAVASISGLLDLESYYSRGAIGGHARRATGGSYEATAAKGDDIMKQLRTHVENGVKLPKFFACCGTEDYLYQDSVRWRSLCAELNVPLTYEEWPGIHDWLFWDKAIEKILAWLPIQGR